jgi:hypothetical protein
MMMQILQSRALSNLLAAVTSPRALAVLGLALIALPSNISGSSVANYLGVGLAIAGVVALLFVLKKASSKSSAMRPWIPRGCGCLLLAVSHVERRLGALGVDTTRKWDRLERGLPSPRQLVRIDAF